MNKVRQFRKDNKLTQTDLAKFLGVSEPFISRVENGLNKMPGSKMKMIIGNKNGWDISALKVPEKEDPIKGIIYSAKALLRELEQTDPDGVRYYEQEEAKHLERLIKEYERILNRA